LASFLDQIAQELQIVGIRAADFAIAGEGREAGKAKRPTRPLDAMGTHAPAVLITAGQGLIQLINIDWHLVEKENKKLLLQRGVTHRMAVERMAVDNRFEYCLRG
jgi:hypothetical protein